MIFPKVRVTTKKEKCQFSLCRSTFSNHSTLGLCFLLKALSSGWKDMRMCVERGGGWSGARRRRWGTKICWMCYCQKDTLWMFHPFVWNCAGVMSGELAHRVPEPWAAVDCDNPERTASRSQATGSLGEGRHTLIHKCLPHALNGWGPWWISSPDAFSMRPTLSLSSEAQPRQKGLYHLFPSSLLL